MTATDKEACQLKSCPFCGGEAEIQGSNFDNGWWVQCKDCCSTSPICDEILYCDEAESHNVPIAIAAWSARTADTEGLFKEVELLRFAVIPDPDEDEFLIYKTSRNTVIDQVLDLIRQRGAKA